jgi:aspartate racemase
MDAATNEAGVIGVLGGMGPLATVDFLRKLVEATPAMRDQEHVPVVVSSIPQVPDRTAAYRGEGESPLPALLASGQRLAAAGAGLVVMPCNTAHLWFDALQRALALPMLHIVDAALDELAALDDRPERVGLLATDATLSSGLYVNRTGAGVQWLLPTADEVARFVEPGIAAVKGGRSEAGRELLRAAAQGLERRGARALVLACTEIPLVLDRDSSELPLVDATAALARAAVRWALGRREAELQAA